MVDCKLLTNLRTLCYTHKNKSYFYFPFIEVKNVLFSFFLYTTTFFFPTTILIFLSLSSILFSVDFLFFTPIFLLYKTLIHIVLTRLCYLIQMFIHVSFYKEIPSSFFRYSFNFNRYIIINLLIILISIYSTIVLLAFPSYLLSK